MTSNPSRHSTTHWAFAASLAVTAIALIACDGAANGTVTSSPEPQSTAALASPLATHASSTVNPRDPITTGNAAVDTLLAALESHDVDALVDRVQFSAKPCGGDGFPPCPSGGPTPRPGQPSTAASGFEAWLCEGGLPRQRYLWQSEPQTVRAAVEQALADATASFVYSVYLGSSSKNGPVHYTIWLGAGATPSPAAIATRWQATENGMLQQLEFDCRDRGVGAWGAAAPPDRYVVAPRTVCDQGETDVFVEIDNRIYNVAHPEFIGVELDAEGQSLARRVLLSIRRDGAGTDYPVEHQPSPPTVDTTYHGAITKLEDIAPGMRVAVHGWRFRNCVVQAWTIEPLR